MEKTASEIAGNISIDGANALTNKLVEALMQRIAKEKADTQLRNE